MTKNAEIFDEIVNQRRSVRVYDEEIDFDESVLDRSIDRMLLSPNSSNLQLWEFYKIKSTDMKAEIAKYCFNQPAAKTARALLVIVTRKDKWKERCADNLEFLDKGKRNGKALKGLDPRDYYKKVMPLVYSTNIPSFLKKIGVALKGITEPMYREVTQNDRNVGVHKSAALAAQTFMLSMKSEGYDTCPMEGFDSKRIKKALKLPRKAEINMIISVGIGKPEGIYGTRFRVAKEKVVFEI